MSLTIEEKARQLAGQAWCAPKTSNKVMDVDLADAFTVILTDALKVTEDMVDLVIWMSGAREFGPAGEGRSKWQREGVFRLDRALQYIKDPARNRPKGYAASPPPAPPGMKYGDKGRVYDRYRFAIPLRCEVVGWSDVNDGVCVRLLESNNPTYPIGSEVWAHRRQIELDANAPVPLAASLEPQPVTKECSPVAMCPACNVIMPAKDYVGHFHDHAVLAEMAR